MFIYTLYYTKKYIPGTWYIYIIYIYHNIYYIYVGTAALPFEGISIQFTTRACHQN